MIQKRWNIKPPAPEDVINRLSKELNIHRILAHLLYLRGITDFDDAKLFFRPQLSHLHDPFLMKDMDKAVARIEKAISSGENILVYGDYDVDGTSAVSLVYSFFTSHFPLITSHFSYYIPDRYKEGYGISIAGVDFAAANNFSLIIALDCGIKAIDKIKYAKDKSIDFIICDHHLPDEKIPDAVAVLDPKRSDCNYPYKELSGCGIGLKLVQGYLQKNNPEKGPENLEPYLDLAAISIASDIVPITGENRILAYYGLKKINACPRDGIRALLEVAGVKREITVNELVFVIGPRINAAGRMESGKKAVELFISSSSEIAIESGRHLNKNNFDRRDLDISITQQALQMIAGNPELKNKKTTVLFDPSWHKGVIGIVASRLTETYYRPTIMLTQSDGVVCGSARSVRGFDIYKAVEGCCDLLEQFGGHKFAAGLTLRPENVEAFSKRFEDVVASTITDEMLIPEIEIDAEINFSEITPKFYSVLKQFAPFGPGNMSPVFLTENVLDNSSAKIVGKNHLKMELVQMADKTAAFSAIGFGMGDHYDFVTKKESFSVCYHIEEQQWKERKYLQLRVKDFAKA